jgi:hypothetical protein
LAVTITGDRATNFDLRNEFIFLFGDGVSPEKKMMETTSLRVAHDAKFPSFFFK